MTNAPPKLVWTEVTGDASLDDLVQGTTARSAGCIFERRGDSGFSVLALGEARATPISGRDAFAFVRTRLRTAPTDATTAPFPFHGGVWAIVNYEALCRADGSSGRDTAGPSGWIVNLERYVIADHRNGRLYAAALIRDGEDETSALSALSADVVALLNDSARYPRTTSRDQGDSGGGQSRVETPPRGQYEESVAKAQHLMWKRGVREVVISLPMFIEGLGERQFGRLYQQMRSMRPTPYMAFLAAPELRIAINSTLGCAEIRSRQVRAETDAATRYADQQEPGIPLAWHISSKERDEHQYALDALREDMRLITIPGPVQLLTSAEPRRFGNVVHLFAEMGGTLRNGLDPVDAVAQLSPHGAVSGMPKKGAIEIARLIECETRGPYGGLVGIFGFDGFTSAATIIRSTWQENEGTARARFGASVTLASEPKQEYDECIAKAEALLASLSDIA
jgi:anthranilate/para-aminobenzoate synthase component I